MSDSVVTEYRYITRVPGVSGGRPIVKGSRIPVKAIVGYYKLGLAVEEILEGLPNLTPAQVHEALSYYYDHQSEIEQDITESRVEKLIERYGLTTTVDGRIVLAPRDDS
jgi:uncharacterized protein (DUF433 family)